MRTRTPGAGFDSTAATPPSPTTNLKRRRFLFSLGAGGAGAAAVAALPASAVVDEPSAAADAGDTGYRESAHVRGYYRTARI